MNLYQRAGPPFSNGNHAETQNAFVLPGGKVFVFSGILQLTRNDSGLAAVLGHEIAHNLANHVGERMSSDLGTNFLMWPMIILTAPFGGLPLLMQLFGWGALDLAFGRPMNRRQETEADFIGLMMMAEACYDPREAASFWARMEKAHQMEPPEWLSTHPSVRISLSAIAGLSFVSNAQSTADIHPNVEREQDTKDAGMASKGVRKGV